MDNVQCHKESSNMESIENMQNIIESRKTAILNRQLARSERHTREAEEKKKEFLQKLRLAEAGQERAAQADTGQCLEAQQVKSALNGADAENQRNQLMTMLMN